MRKLVFEPATLVLSDLKSQVSDAANQEGARPMPYVEKASRWEEQQSRLSGLRLTAELQPAFALVDKIHAMAKSGAISYVCPSKCASREQEILSSSKDSQIIRVENRSLII